MTLARVRRVKVLALPTASLIIIFAIAAFAVVRSPSDASVRRTGGARGRGRAQSLSSTGTRQDSARAASTNASRTGSGPSGPILRAELPRAGRIADAQRAGQPAGVQVATAQALGVPVSFTNDLGIRFVLVPAGTFLMGSPKEEAGRGSDEDQHVVTFTTCLYVATTEVTNAQFREFRSDHRSLQCGRAGASPGRRRTQELAVRRQRAGRSQRCNALHAGR